MSEKTFKDELYKQTCSEKTLQSNSQGFFLDFANYVEKQCGQSWVKCVFGNLTSDKDRINCVYTSKEIGELLQHFLSNVQEVYRPKNSELSQKCRLEAEALCKENDLKKALLKFSESVLRAARTGEETKVDSGLSLAMALWRRAEILMKLQKFSNALIDIQQALKENLPESYKARSFWYMGICYAALKEENKAKIAFSLAEKLLQNDKENLTLLIRKREEFCMILSNPTSLGEHFDKLQITGQPSTHLPHASDKLSVKTSKTTGRYIVANQKISTGEVLVVEPSYAACLLPEMFGSHCHHCFKSLESPFGCNDCARVAFCTLECKNQAMSTYHRYECKYLDLLIGSGMSILGHIALRIVTQHGLKKSLELYQNRKKERVYTLCTNSHLRTPGDFLQRTLMAAFLLRCLQKTNFFGLSRSERVIPSDTEQKIGEILLFNLQILQFNAHEIYETRPNPDSRIRCSKSVYIAVGLYLTASLFNHDCLPALSRHFVGRDIVLTSTKPLDVGELVPENYGPIFTRKNLAERKRSLSSRYWFNCQCLACNQDWPSIGRGLEEVSKRLRCSTSQCPYIFTLPVSKNPLRCPRCTRIVDLANREEILKRCEDQYRQASDLMQKCLTREAMGILCEAIDSFYTVSVPPNKDTHLAEEMLRVCLAANGISV